MSRFIAGGIHLVLSLLVGLTLLAMCWFVWYPAPMLLAIGGQEIFLLIVGIDVVLGPLLTLIVFKSGKPSLKFDLAVIATLQVAAMLYGVSTLLEARPVYVAALGDSFQVVQATEVTDANLTKANTTMPWLGPKWVGTRAPEDRYDIDAVADVTRSGGGRGHFPQLHVPIDTVQLENLLNAKSISELRKSKPTENRQIDKWLSSHGYNDDSVKFQPIKINATTYVVMLDAKSGRAIGLLAIAI
jgi:hypothetical protein